MAIFLPDTNCIVARASSWHPDHAAVRAEFERRLDRGDEMILAAPTLVESYSTLTRMPPPNRASPAAVVTALRDGFITNRRVVALDAAAFLELLHDASRRGIAGGSVYDAIIAACARLGGATTLLTSNARRFAPFAGPDLEIVVPS